MKKKADASGIGLSRAEAEAAAGQWWNDAFQNAAKSINVPGSSSSGSSTSDGDSSSDDSSDDDSEDEAVRASLSRDLSTYTEEDIALFRACKGKAMRKRGRLQTGKMKREQEADRKFLEKWGAAKTSSSGNATETLKKVMNESKLIDSAIAAQLTAPRRRKKAEKAKRKAEKAKRKAEKAKKKKKKKKEKKAKGEKKKKRKRTSEIDDAQDAAAKKMKKKKRKEKKASSLK